MFAVIINAEPLVLCVGVIMSIENIGLLPFSNSVRKENAHPYSKDDMQHSHFFLEY